jgi:hypothetical protein
VQPTPPRYKRLTIQIPHTHDTEISWSSSAEETTSPLSSPPSRYYPAATFQSEQGRESLRMQLFAVLKMLYSAAIEAASE